MHTCTLCPQNDTDVGHYKFDIHKPILIIFGRNLAERENYQTVFVVCFSTAFKWCLCTTCTWTHSCYYYYYYYLTPVLNSQGMKKIRYAIPKIQKSSWNEPYSSSSFTKQSCSTMALYRWNKTESRWNKNLISLSSPDWSASSLLLVLLLCSV